jgi:protein-S-isoprenylcysteine O-methyltransferase Ste14
MRVPHAVAGSALFLLVAPGTVAGLVPWSITGWHVRSRDGWSGLVVGVGVVVVAAGVVVLLEQFLRFAVRGRGTPAPAAPPPRLVVTGLYRHVRNPMYVAVLVILIGENLLMPSAALAVYTCLAGAAMAAFARWYEEPALLARFGQDYRSYRASVPGWIPARLGTRPRTRVATRCPRSPQK